ncbi:MAG: hypothetical protein M3552_00400 [Planctomycetota bacterium]|nr:hypothetical protein [Planctomycetaceae bacterium]MDQ3329105.1 hypothetical protein [Planctomycetota bacterium]
METLTRRDLDTLLAAESSHCVSLYMPTHRTGGPESREDATRFSNLIRNADDALRARGVNGLRLQAIIKSLEELKHDSVFWQNQADGLAIFFEGEERRLFRLPLSFRERCVVAPRFHVRPLLPLLQGDGRFYILAVSQNSVRLFQGSRFALTEIQDERLPKNLREALNIDEYIQSLQFSSMKGAGIGDGARGGAAFHGHGGSNMDVKKSDELLPYFRRIDAALQELFGAEDNPLVFAGVEYLFPLFKEASQYNALIEEPVTGNVDRARPGELHAQAWPLVEHRFERVRDSELERLAAQSDPKPHSHDLPEILSAARVGQIETLFLSERADVFGHVDFAEDGRVVQGEEAGDGEDLLNVAAVETLRTGGKVFTVSGDALSNSSPVAARLRWAVGSAPVGDGNAAKTR